jgi:hypothetical protein
MGLITSTNHAKQLDEYEAMAGVAKAMIQVDTAKGLANFLKVSAGLLRTIASAPAGKLVIYDAKRNSFLTRDPKDGPFEHKDKDAETLRCRMVAGAVQKHLGETEPAVVEALLEQLAALNVVGDAKDAEPLAAGLTDAAGVQS